MLDPLANQARKSGKPCFKCLVWIWFAGDERSSLTALFLIHEQRLSCCISGKAGSYLDNLCRFEISDHAIEHLAIYRLKETIVNIVLVRNRRFLARELRIFLLVLGGKLSK